MSSERSDGEAFDRLADSFLARLRSGERPSVSEYADCYPSLAEKILDLFPALVEMEGLKPGTGGPTGSFVAGAGRVPGVVLPERLGDYRILREIGSGGMGIVYEAERESLRAHVALKVLHARCRDTLSYRARFRNEARSAARLHHTNIVQVFDFGEHEGILYYAMQYIAGQGLDLVLRDVRGLRERRPAAAIEAGDSLTPTLAEALHTGRYPQGSGTPDGSTPGATRSLTSLPFSMRTNGVGAAPADAPSAHIDDDHSSPSYISSLGDSDQLRYHREVARIGAEVASALGYAHGRGVLHRDIKPSNLLLDARGTAWVTDFGLAKFDGSEDLTETGEFVGTLRYMAPERFDGRSDAGCDVYALGVTLYEMLALRPPFDGTNRAVLVRRILDHAPPPLRKLDPRISLDLSTVVNKAMAREPSDRFASADELADELRRVASNQPIKSRRIPMLEQYWRWCKRNPLMAGLNALAATLMITIAVISTTAAVWLNRSNQELDRSNAEVNKQLVLVRKAEAQQREQLWEANFARARASRSTRRSGQRFDALAAIAEAVKLGRELGHPRERFDRLRNEALAALALPDIQTAGEFGQRTDDVRQVDTDENFELYAVSNLQCECIVRRIADDTEVGRLPLSGRPREILFGPGRLLWDHDSGTSVARVWDLSGPKPVLRIDERRAVVGAAFHPDGDRLFSLHPNGDVTVYHLPTGQRRTLHATRDSPRGLRMWIGVHPTAPYIVVSSYLSYGVQIRHLETGGTVLVEPPWRGRGSYTCAWSPDGRILVVTNPDLETLALYEFAGSPPTVRLLRTIEKAGGTEARFNTAGDRLFSRGWGHSIHMFDAGNGRELFTTRPFLEAVAPVLRPDPAARRLFPGPWNEPMRRFAYASVAEGREYRLMTPASPRQGDHPVPEPDAAGRLVVAATAWWISFYDVRTGQEVGAIRIPGEPGRAYAFFDQTGHLLTNIQPVGCFRWPVRQDPVKRDNLLIGPPERLSLHPGYDVSTSRNGAVVAQAMYNGYGTAPYAGGWILHRDRPDPPRHEAPGVSMRGVSVSPDGRWVAFSGDRSFVFDTRTERPAWEPHQDLGVCRFSPDGKWLATEVDGGRLYAVGTWEPGPQLGHGIIRGFSGDGATALLNTEVGYLRLVEAGTGRELARFESPDPSPGHVAMTVDGTKLLEPQKDGIRLWDLRLIRAELAKLGLDWDAPPFPPEANPEGPLTVTIIGAKLLDPESFESRIRRLLAPWLKGNQADPRDYLLRADELVRQGWHDLALRDYSACIRRFPALTEARMHRGLELFRRGGWAAAAEDFRAVLAEDPKDPSRGSARSRLSWSYHELGRHADAAAELVKLLEVSPSSWQAEDRAGLLLLRAEFYDRVGKPVVARADRDLAAEVFPKLAEAANHRAWRWLMPPPDLTPAENWRFVPAALLLARKAVELAPDEPLYWNTLGVALCLNGNYDEARTALQASLARGKGLWDAWDLFPLAMCHHHLGDRKAARESYDRAVAWVKSHENSLMGDPRELADLRAEARRLLGLRD